MNCWLLARRNALDFLQGRHTLHLVFLKPNIKLTNTCNQHIMSSCNQFCKYSGETPQHTIFLSLNPGRSSSWIHRGVNHTKSKNVRSLSKGKSGVTCGSPTKNGERSKGETQHIHLKGEVWEDERRDKELANGMKSARVKDLQVFVLCQGPKKTKPIFSLHNFIPFWSSFYGCYMLPLGYGIVWLQEWEDFCPRMIIFWEKETTDVKMFLI